VYIYIYITAITVSLETSSQRVSLTV